MSVETPKERLDRAKKAVAGTGIVALLATGLNTGDYYLNPRVDLAHRKFTPYEYEQIRPELIRAMQSEPNLIEKRMFRDAYNIENKKERFKFSGLTIDNFEEKAVEAMAFREFNPTKK